MDRVSRESAAADAVGDARLVSRHRECSLDGVLDLLAAADPPATLWAPPDGPVSLGLGVAARVTGSGIDRFESVRREATALLDDADAPTAGPARPRFFGGAAFHVDHEENGHWTDFPDAAFVLPATQVTVDPSGEGTADEGPTATVVANVVGPNADAAAAEASLEAAVADIETAVANIETAPTGTVDHESPGIAARERTTSREAWREQVTAATDRITAGELRKVVLAQALSVEPTEPVAPASVLARLDATYPDCYRFLVQPGGRAAFLGATPECLVGLEGGHVETEALAGSTGRGDTRAEDEWLAAELADSEKDRHEHALVVDAIRGQLEPWTAGVETGELDVRQLATVQHLLTPITAELSGEAHILELVDSLHPTPAVGGLPPERALATIRETETFSRGWYAAPVGWFDAAGDGEFAVAIRAALATDPVDPGPRYRRLRLFAGAGVVRDSDPDWEWDEVQLKYRPIVDALE